LEFERAACKFGCNNRFQCRCGHRSPSLHCGLPYRPHRGCAAIVEQLTIAVKQITSKENPEGTTSLRADWLAA
jgi:hypothetical protein